MAVHSKLTPDEMQVRLPSGGRTDPELTVAVYRLTVMASPVSPSGGWVQGCALSSQLWRRTCLYRLTCNVLRYTLTT